VECLFYQEEAFMEGVSTSTAVVLVHGGFVDGSGWQSVYEILTNDGYKSPVSRTGEKCH
jgi:hypothetical protein